MAVFVELTDDCDSHEMGRAAPSVPSSSKSDGTVMVGRGGSVWRLCFGGEAMLL